MVEVGVEVVMVEGVVVVAVVVVGLLLCQYCSCTLLLTEAVFFPLEDD